MSSDKGRTTEVTIKYGKGEDSTAVTFTGTPREIRQDIAEYFGMPHEAIEGLALNEVVVNATREAQNLDLLRSELGAVAVPQPKPPAPTPSTPADDPWAVAEKSPGEPDKPEWLPSPEEVATETSGNQYYINEINKQTTLDGLKKFWASNQAAFSDAEVMNAYKARGKAIKNGA